MNLDLRIPMGIMFTLVGAILTLQGIVTRGSDIYDRSVGVNINLDWGIIMLVFGLLMFLLGRRGQRRMAMEPPAIEGTTRPLGGHGHH
jgi:multisubunit Na+/H+ antiporter MnhG subunit